MSDVPDDRYLYAVAAAAAVFCCINSRHWET